MTPLLLLTLGAALGAEALDVDFEDDAGPWEGGAVSGGVLALDGGSAAVELGALASLTATLRLRAVGEGTVSVSAGDATWAAAYAEGGALTLGEEGLPFPYGHYTLAPDDAPVLRAGTDYWEAGGVLHCDIHYDDASSTYFLFYTGVMSPGYGYRQIGIATSPDAETWTRYAGNPVLTIDYSADIDGVHVHMPTVVTDDDGTWHMFYSCYQNDVGNRACHATSPDGYAWTPEGVALDFGEAGEFDDAGVRMPDVLIGDDGTWHMLYNGTRWGEHYGPTGHATSADGWTWTREDAVSDDEYRLQGGGMVETAYGVEQWWNCEDVFCYSVADPDDWSVWTDADEVVLAKGWAPWSEGYVQAPSPWVIDDTYHLWFNAYDPYSGLETLGHARSEPAPGSWFELTLSWDGEALTASMDGGPALTTPLAEASGLRVSATGQAEVDYAYMAYSLREDDPGDSDAGDSDAGDSDAGDSDQGDTGPVADVPTEAKGGCGCGGGGAAGLILLAVLPVARRRRGVGRG